MNVGFFTAITYSSQIIASKRLKAIKRVDDYFYLQGKKAKVISVNKDFYSIQLVPCTASPIITALKIASYCTIIIPAIMLTAKLILRWRVALFIQDSKPKAPTTPKVNQILNQPYLIKKEVPLSSHKKKLLFSDGRTETYYYKHNSKHVLANITNFLDDPEKYVQVVSSGSLEHLIPSKGYSQYKIDQSDHRLVFYPSAARQTNSLVSPDELINIKCTISVRLHKSKKKIMEIKSLSQLKKLLERVYKYVYRHHSGIVIRCKGEQLSLIIKGFKLSTFSSELDFKIIDSSRISIVAKPIKQKHISQRELVRIFKNGVQEKFFYKKDSIVGCRSYPNGKKEIGIFAEETTTFSSGYTIHPNGSVKFYNSDYGALVEIGSSSYTHLIKSFEELEELIKITIEKSSSKNLSTILLFPNRHQLEQIKYLLQQIPGSDSLQFYQLPSDPPNILCLRIKPKSSEVLDSGEIRETFFNGIAEILTLHENNTYEGTRIYPNGRKEIGKFNLTRKFLQGIVKQNQCYYYYKPSCILSVSANKYFRISDGEKGFTVYESDDGKHFIESKHSVEDVLSKKNLDDQEILAVFTHSHFDERLKPFIKKLISTKQDSPSIFNLPEEALHFVLNFIKEQRIRVNPLKLIDARTGQKNIIKHAAYLATDFKLIELLGDLWPKAFLKYGVDIIIMCFKKNFYDTPKVIKLYQDLGGTFNSFYELCSQTASIISYIQHKKEFKVKFKALTREQQQTIYDIAFSRRNPYVMEPAKITIQPNQYSINFLWIGRTKTPNEQLYLFGKGSSEEERSLNFHKQFIHPITEWAAKNPGTAINVWIDSDMSPPPVIERTVTALKDALEEIGHDAVFLRDIRNLKTVNQFPRVFEETVPVYFRVDLAKAIIADTVMQENAQFFVFADLDVTPLSRKKLFDKRTLDFLNDYGFVMAGAGLRYENSFQIFNKHHEQFVKSHRKVIIELTIDMFFNRRESVSEQQIYDTYVPMFAHQLHHDGRFGKIKSRFHEDTYFQIDNFGGFGHLETKSERVNVRRLIPTKPVKVPASHFFLSSRNKNNYE